MATFYTTFDEIKDSKYDGMIITGAPVENLEYEDVDYWGELTRIMDWSKTHVTSTLHICWAALAGLYYHYGVPKHPLKEKCSGVFKHKGEQTHGKSLYEVLTMNFTHRIHVFRKCVQRI